MDDNYTYDEGINQNWIIFNHIVIYNIVFFKSFGRYIIIEKVFLYLIKYNWIKKLFNKKDKIIFLEKNISYI
jgi:hypothetical protein